MASVVESTEKTQEIPDFINKFSECTDTSTYCKQLKEQGYTHYLNLRTNRVTIGSIEDEYSVLVAGVFSKGAPRSFKHICESVTSGEFPLLEQRKFYSMMSSTGRGYFSATLDADELMSWITFFECDAGYVCKIEELI